MASYAPHASSMIITVNLMNFQQHTKCEVVFRIQSSDNMLLSGFRLK